MSLQTNFSPPELVETDPLHQQPLRHAPSGAVRRAVLVRTERGSLEPIVGPYQSRSENLLPFFFC